jgi:hypothetical protein
VQATSDGFDFGQLWHGSPVYGMAQALIGRADYLLRSELNCKIRELHSPSVREYPCIL